MKKLICVVIAILVTITVLVCVINTKDSAVCCLADGCDKPATVRFHSGSVCVCAEHASMYTKAMIQRSSVSYTK